jgi:MSHA biogenesis protein MshN
MAALALKPARGAWWVGLAISLEALGRGQEAARAYRTALAETELNADLINYARARVTQLDVTAAGG